MHEGRAATGVEWQRRRRAGKAPCTCSGWLALDSGITIQMMFRLLRAALVVKEQGRTAAWPRATWTLLWDAVTSSARTHTAGGKGGGDQRLGCTVGKQEQQPGDIEMQPLQFQLDARCTILLYCPFCSVLDLERHCEEGFISLRVLSPQHNKHDV